MTWSTFTSTATIRGGSASLQYRVQFAGMPYEPVSHENMTRALDVDNGLAARVAGLRIQGRKLGYNVNIAQCRIEGESLNIALVDTRRTAKWTELFTKQPTRRCWLTSDVDDVDTIFPTTDVSEWPSEAAAIWIDGECCSIDGPADPTSLSVTARGLFGSHAAYHYAANEASVTSPEITNWPLTIEGARVKLYAYAAGDSPTGDGTLIWQGVVSAEPSNTDGTTWQVRCDPITSVLKQSLGNDLGSFVPRGIHYSPRDPECWLSLIVHEYETSTIPPPATAVRTDYVCDSISGHYESNDELVEAVNTALDDAGVTAGISGTLLAKSDGPSGWHFEYTAGVSAYVIGLEVLSAVDGPFGETGGRGVGFPQLVSGDGIVSPAPSVQNNTTYVFRQPPPRGTVPRGAMGRIGTWYFDARLPPNAATSAWKFAAHTPPGGITPMDEADIPLVLTGDIDSATASGYFVFPHPHDFLCWTAYQPPVARFGINLNSVVGIDGHNSLYNLMQALQTQTPELSNLGIQPSIYSTDWDTSSWSVLSSGTQPSVVSSRNYVMWTQRTLEEVVRQELLLAGYIPSVTSSGALGIAKLRLAAVTDPGTVDIVSTDILNDKQKLCFEKGAFGLWNTFTYVDGYDADEDKFKGRTYNIRDVSAFSRAGSARTVRSTPFSRYNGPQPVSINDLTALAMQTLGVLGHGYSVLTMEVSARLWDVAIGDTVRITYGLLPSNAGTVGADDRTGVVIGWTAETYSPRVTLRILLSPRDYAGYAPAVTVTAWDDQGGNLWKLSVTGSGLFPTGADVTDFFEVGQRVMARRYNHASSSSQTGEITAVTNGATPAGFMYVQFDGAIVPASDSYYITFSDADDADLTDGQKRYVFIANATSAIEFDAGNEPAEVLGP